MDLVSIADLQPADLQAIWALAARDEGTLAGTVGWSFEGNGIRTRTTFLQAFRELGLAWTELPNLLKSGERAGDLAGYLDPFYDAYVVREANHLRIMEFAAASRRPVVNAMSSNGHPCEVLADAWFIDRSVRPLAQARICLWGPTTNVFRSWHQLAEILELDLVHACDRHFHEPGVPIRFLAEPPREVDVVVTDGWLLDYEDPAWSLSAQHLARMGSPRLLPTPPFSVGHELAIDPAGYAGFVGYQQKRVLVPVQKAILRWALGN